MAVFEITDPNVVIELVIRRNVGSIVDGATSSNSSDKQQSNKASETNIDESDKPKATPITKPGPHDVVCGRGGGTNAHPGNKTFRELIAAHKSRYVTADKIDKPRVAREVVKEWRHRDPPGRFLVKVDNSSGGEVTWLDVGDKKATEKASQCLREKRGGTINEDSDVEMMEFSNTDSVADGDSCNDNDCDEMPSNEALAAKETTADEPETHKPTSGMDGSVKPDSIVDQSNNEDTKTNTREENIQMSTSGHHWPFYAYPPLYGALQYLCQQQAVARWGGVPQDASNDNTLSNKSPVQNARKEVEVSENNIQ